MSRASFHHASAQEFINSLEHFIQLKIQHHDAEQQINTVENVAHAVAIGKAIAAAREDLVEDIREVFTRGSTV